MIYICENKDCSEYGKEHIHMQNSYSLVNGEWVSNNAQCPCCKKLRKEINPDEVPLSEKNIDLLRYDMCDKQQQREILKKRSHEHFEKEVKPYKEFRIQTEMDKFKEASRV